MQATLFCVRISPELFCYFSLFVAVLRNWIWKLTKLFSSFRAFKYLLGKLILNSLSELREIIYAFTIVATVELEARNYVASWNWFFLSCAFWSNNDLQTMSWRLQARFVWIRSWLTLFMHENRIVESQAEISEIMIPLSQNRLIFSRWLSNARLASV